MTSKNDNVATQTCLRWFKEKNIWNDSPDAFRKAWADWKIRNMDHLSEKDEKVLQFVKNCEVLVNHDFESFRSIADVLNLDDLPDKPQDDFVETDLPIHPDGLTIGTIDLDVVTESQIDNVKSGGALAPIQYYEDTEGEKTDNDEDDEDTEGDDEDDEDDEDTVDTVSENQLDTDNDTSNNLPSEMVSTSDASLAKNITDMTTVADTVSDTFEPEEGEDALQTLAVAAASPESLPQDVAQQAAEIATGAVGNNASAEAIKQLAENAVSGEALPIKQVIETAQEAANGMQTTPEGQAVQTLAVGAASPDELSKNEIKDAVQVVQGQLQTPEGAAAVETLAEQAAAAQAAPLVDVMIQSDDVKGTEQESEKKSMIESAGERIEKGLNSMFVSPVNQSGGAQHSEQIISHLVKMKDLGDYKLNVLISRLTQMPKNADDFYKLLNAVSIRLKRYNASRIKSIGLLENKMDVLIPALEKVISKGENYKLSKLIDTRLKEIKKNPTQSSQFENMVSERIMPILSGDPITVQLMNEILGHLKSGHLRLANANELRLHYLKNVETIAKPIVEQFVDTTLQRTFAKFERSLDAKNVGLSEKLMKLLFKQLDKKRGKMTKTIRLISMNKDIIRLVEQIGQNIESVTETNLYPDEKIKELAQKISEVLKTNGKRVDPSTIYSQSA